MGDSDKCRVITVAYVRGGCGKTFLSTHLAYMLAERRQRVLLIDTDPQGTVGVWLGLDHAGARKRPRAVSHRARRLPAVRP